MPADNRTNKTCNNKLSILGQINIEVAKLGSLKLINSCFIQFNHISINDGVIDDLPLINSCHNLNYKIKK